MTSQLAKIKIVNQLPGMGGLNLTALYEDGWAPGMVVEIIKQFSADRWLVKWGDGPTQNRTVFRHELEFLPTAPTESQTGADQSPSKQISFTQKR